MGFRASADCCSLCRYYLYMVLCVPGTICLQEFMFGLSSHPSMHKVYLYLNGSKPVDIEKPKCIVFVLCS